MPPTNPPRAPPKVAVRKPFITKAQAETAKTKAKSSLNGKHSVNVAVPRPSVLRAKKSVDDDEPLPGIKSEPGNSNNVEEPVTKVHKAKSVGVRAFDYMATRSRVCEVDKPVVEYLIQKWKQQHQSLGTKVLVRVVKCVRDGFLKNEANSSNGKAGEAWREVLNAYPCRIVGKGYNIRDLDEAAQNMKDQLFRATDKFPLILKAKKLIPEFSTELDGTYNDLKDKANDLAHELAVEHLGKSYVEQVRSDPAKKYIICPPDATPTPAVQRPELLQAQPAADTPVSQSPEQRADEFVEISRRARAKARVTAELKLEEMEAQEMLLQVRIEKIKARRELLELGTGDNDA